MEDTNLIIVDGVERMKYCQFPDCGCDGARNCDAVKGAGYAANTLNREKHPRTWEMD